MDPDQVAPEDEERDTVAPQPEEGDPGDAGGDSPGTAIGVPDRPAASDRHGTTAAEQADGSLERRLAMERPDVADADAGEPDPDVMAIVDDDVAAEDAGVEEAGFEAGEADIDRTRAEVADESPFERGDGPEETAMHIEPDQGPGSGSEPSQAKE
jgi:hypothetical protein